MDLNKCVITCIHQIYHAEYITALKILCALLIHPRHPRLPNPGLFHFSLIFNHLPTFPGQLFSNHENDLPGPKCLCQTLHRVLDIHYLI